MTVVYSRNGRSSLPLDTGSVLPVSPDYQTLYAMSQAILDRVKACAMEKGLALPGREVIYTSPIPADCEQVAVLFDGWAASQQEESLVKCNAFRWLGSFSVVVTRCTPALPGKRGDPPKPADMHASALIASRDAELMICVVTSLEEVGTAVQIITHSPEGGFQTVELDVQIPATGALD